MIKLNFKNLIFFLCFLYLTLYLPLSLMVYSNSWYEFNYNNQETYQILGENITNNVTTNLINFFEYKQDLNSNWNPKEVLHMSDVRNIYSILFILGVLSFFGFTYFFENNKQIKKFSKINIIIISSLILILPFFIYFWDKIFHLILFNNNAWLITPSDISYYLFSYNFFRNSLIFMIISSIIINLIVFFGFRKKLNNKS